MKKLIISLILIGGTQVLAGNFNERIDVDSGLGFTYKIAMKGQLNISSGLVEYLSLDVFKKDVASPHAGFYFAGPGRLTTSIANGNLVLTFSSATAGMEVRTLNSDFDQDQCTEVGANIDACVHHSPAVANGSSLSYVKFVNKSKGFLGCDGVSTVYPETLGPAHQLLVNKAFLGSYLSSVDYNSIQKMEVLDKGGKKYLSVIAKDGSYRMGQGDLQESITDPNLKEELLDLSKVKKLKFSIPDCNISDDNSLSG